MKPLDPTKEESILNAVYNIAGKHGLVGINITAISKEAGVSVGTIYTYFENKENLIQKAFFHIKDQFTQFIYRDFDFELPVKESLKKIYRNLLNYRLKFNNEITFIEQYYQSKYIHINVDEYFDFFHEHNKMVYDLFKKGQQQGVIAEDINIELLVAFITNAIFGLSNVILKKAVPMNDKNLEDYFELIWTGLGK